MKLAIVGAVIVGSLLTGAPAGRRKEGARPPNARAPERHAATARGAPRTAPGPRLSQAAVSSSKRASEAVSTPCTRYAAPWGSKRGNGTAVRPFRGPYGLVRSLRAGETGCLRFGTYQQRETIVRRQGITLRSAPGERATWRGRVVLQGRADRLLGLTLDGSYGPRCPERGCGTLPSPTINAAQVVIAYDDITSPNSGICVHPRSWRRQRPDRFLILGNRVHDCGRMPHTEHDHGIYVANGTHGEIRDNVVFSNADRGVQLYPDARGTLVIHNTVDGNGSGVVFSERSSGNQVRDNVFTNSVVRWNAETFNLSGSGNRFSGNCVRAGNRDPQYNENGGVALPRNVVQHGNRRTHDSVYVARRAADFRVLPTSACAGKGAPDSTAAPLRP
jgi:parallel beta-helix repeat protein